MPILNHRDYRSAIAQIALLTRALGPSGVIEDIASNVPADVTAARQQVLRTELRRLQADVAAYEKLRGDEINSEPEIDVDDLGLLPIIARITRRLSQRELAERLEVKEQQVQRYESERYAGISLSRYQKILDALGIELQPEDRFHYRTRTSRTFREKRNLNFKLRQISPSRNFASASGWNFRTVSVTTKLPK